MRSFKNELKKKLELSQANNYGITNYDEYIFGKYPNLNLFRANTYKRIKRFIIRLINTKRTTLIKNQIKLQNEDLPFIYGDKLQQIYKLLDARGKNLLIDIIAYRLLGYRKVKLPRNNMEYWDAIKIGNSLENKNDMYDPHFMHLALKKVDLHRIGYDIQFYYSGYGVAIDFIIEQYAYKIENKSVIAVNEGDVVFDLGACWGDTALYFAAKTGIQGKVYSFEFIPDNIKLFNKNIDLNPILKNQIELVEHPVSNTSDEKIYFLDNGPASRIEFEPFDGYNGIAITTSMDDFVKRNNIQKVDFIKMDIEGAEELALEGAIETIKKFKPKLAIAIYHNMNQFVNVPIWINNLDLGYKLYLEHFSIYTGETVIFAKVV